MGKRLLRNMIIQPHNNIEIIQRNYEIIQKLIDNKKLLNEITDGLLKINDIERLLRKLSLNILHPIDLYNLIDGVNRSIEIFNTLL